MGRCAMTTLWSIRNYRMLFSSSAISNLGDGVSALAFPWLATLITRDPMLIALVAFAARLPWLLLPIPAGVGTDPARRRQDWTVEARYLGQSFEADAPTTPGEPLEDFIARFHAAHAREHGYDIRSRQVEIVNCRVKATATGFKSTPARAQGRDGAAEPLGSRDIAFASEAGLTVHATPIYDREALGPGATLMGPAVIVEKTSTTVAPPDWRIRVDDFGNLLLETEVRIGPA